MRTDARVQDTAKVVSPVLLLRSLAFYFLVIIISMITTAYPAQASGTVQTTVSWTDAWGFTSSDPMAFCGGYLRDASAVNGASYTLKSYPVDPITHVLSCYGDIAPPSNLLNAYLGSFPPNLGCPVNSLNTSYYGMSCTCNTNFRPDSTTTRCVPQNTCLVTTKVAEITDPVALLYENGTYSATRPDLLHLTPETQAGLACIQQKVAALNCYKTPQATSGYRPTAYQTHILEVYDKWQLIKNNNAPECAETKRAIREEYIKHSHFARRPGVTSNHSHVDAQGNPAGNAVDISNVPDNALDSADAIACQCNMYRPMIHLPNPSRNDPVHYQPRICPH
jgi:hypothetical protein